MRQLLTKAYNLWQLTRASLLYVPALFCAAFTLAGIGLFLLDLRFKEFWSETRFIYIGDIDEASDVVSLLLTAMVTMTTLVISITMVVLSLSASQLGPRIVRVFMSDRRTKAYFGIFFGAIVLCFTCLRILHDPLADESAPRLLTSVTFAVCFLTLFVLLAYVDHVARSTVADNIIARLTRELTESIARLAPERGKAKNPADCPGDSHFPDLTAYERSDIRCHTNGYIQSIQYQTLIELAKGRDAFIQLDNKPGDCVVEGQCVGKIYSRASADTSRLIREVKHTIVLGEYRSATQDIEYSIRHMVEIALRALSPGVNDCFTAVTVLDKLTGVLAFLFNRSLPTCAFKDDHGDLRVIGKAVDEAELIYKALSNIREAGQKQSIILENLIGNIAILSRLTVNDSQANALSLQLDQVRQHITDHFSGSPIEDRLHQCLQ